jgi:hypothetical protein
MTAGELTAKLQGSAKNAENTLQISSTSLRLYGKSTRQT